MSTPILYILGAGLTPYEFGAKIGVTPHGREGPAIARSNRNQERRAKYQMLVAAGFDTGTARRARSWSWDRIYRQLAGIQDTSFIKRAFRDIPSRERYRQQYHLLRSAGYTSAEAKRLRTKPPEMVQFLVAVGRQRKASHMIVWNYMPFDRGYTQPYAYKVHYEEIDEDTGEKSRRWITFISHEEQTPESVRQWVLEIVQEYGKRVGRIIEIVAMRAGLPGGVR